MKRNFIKGTVCIFVDENKEITNSQISLDKDRKLEVGDIFIFNEDLENFNHIPMVVVGFMDKFPLIVEVKI